MTKQLTLLESNRSDKSGTCETCIHMRTYRDCCDEYESYCNKFDFRLPGDDQFGCHDYEFEKEHE